MTNQAEGEEYSRQKDDEADCGLEAKTRTWAIISACAKKGKISILNRHIECDGGTGSH